MICGVYHFDGRADAGERVRSMCGALTLYGRDRQNAWDGGDIALACGLTHTVPEDRFDRQPLRAGEGRFVLVADLRLDNREELAGELGIPGGRQAEMADSDLLLAGWERWQTGVVDHLVGPFCFAVWDRAERTLTLVRDHLGVRPLYFHAPRGWFAFATMPKGLLALPEIPRRPNENRLMDYALMQSLSAESFYAGIDGIGRGQITVVHADGRRTTRTYWDPLAVVPLTFTRPEAYGEGLRDVLTTAVRAMLRTTRPIGTQLSAGHDSTAVTAAAARLLAERGGSLTAYTAVPRPGYLPPAAKSGLTDEGPIAARVAARYPNIRHHLVQAPLGGFFEMLDRYAYFNDQPLLNPINGLWLDKIYRSASEVGVGVMLTGGTGNMTISFRGDGYFRELYEAGHCRELLNALRAFRGEYYLSRWRAARLVLGWLAGEADGGFIHRVVRGAHKGQTVSLSSWSPLHPDHFADSQARDRLRSRGYTLDWPTHRQTKQWQAKRFLNPGLSEAFKEGCLAAYGVDTRTPARDLRVVRFCLGIPLRENFRNGRLRSVYREAFSEWVPKEVTELNKSGRQGADWHLLLKAELPELRRELERTPNVPEIQSVLDIPGLRALAAQYPETDDGTRGTEALFAHKLTRGMAALRFGKACATQGVSCPNNQPRRW